MTKLSVNINKVGLIRNSRPGNFPDLIQIAKDCEMWGAHGITVHPRPDERHIRYDDLIPLKNTVQTEFNIEGYPDVRFIQKVIQVKPHQCTLVPDPPGALTSDSGWDTKKHQSFLQEVIGQFAEEGIRVSLFLNADEDQIYYASMTGAQRVELYTGIFAKEFPHNREKAILKHRMTAEAADKMGIGLNAGHDLNLMNLRYYKENVINLLEVSIGHALWVDAIYYGLQNAVAMYLHEIR